VYHLVSRKINLDRTALFFRFIFFIFDIEPVFPGRPKSWKNALIRVLVPEDSAFTFRGSFEISIEETRA